MELFKKEDNILAYVVEYWLSGNVDDVPTTWETLVSALQSKQVGEAGLAKDIAKKFCSKEEKINNSDNGYEEDSESPVSSDTEPLSPSVEMDLKQKLNQNLKIIMKQYAAYLDRILVIVQEKGITAKRLSFFLLSLSASTDDEKKLQLLSDMKDELDKVDEVVDIFMLLGSKYASFLDYDIFEAILAQFGENEKHDDLNYPSHLKNYIEMHKIKEFVKLNPKLSLKIDGNSDVVKIKFNIKITQSLKSLKDVIAAVANILGIQASALRLYSIKRGCVLVLCLIHSTIADTIFMSEMVFTEDQKDKFRAAAVLWLKYKRRKFGFKITDRKGLVESVRKKLNKLYKASIDTDNITATPLHRAVESGNAESVQKLIKPEPKVTPYLQTQLTVRDKKVKERKEVIQKLHPEAGFDLDTNQTKAIATRFRELDEATELLEKSVNELTIEPQEFNRMDEILFSSPKDVSDPPKVTQLTLQKAQLTTEYPDRYYISAYETQTLSQEARLGYLRKKKNVTVAGQMTDFLECSDVCGPPRRNSCPMHKKLMTKNAAEPSQEVAAKAKKRKRRRRRGRGRRKKSERTIISENEHVDVLKGAQSALSTKESQPTTGHHQLPQRSQDIDFLKSTQTTFCPKIKSPDAADESLELVSRELVSQPLSSISKCMDNSMEATHLTKQENTTESPYAANESLELIKIREVLRQPLSPISECIDNSMDVTHHTKQEKTSEQTLYYDVNSVDSLGWTPLHYACATGNLHIVRMLLSEFNADITARDIDGRPPILLAALAGHENVVQVLLTEYQCPADIKDYDGHALIYYACAEGNPHLVQSLILEHKADGNERNGQKNTPLHVAALCGQEDVALILIENFGCDTKARGWIGRSLLHKACAGGSVNLVQTLINEYNADINARDFQNNTPLHVAVLCGNDDVALTLIAKFGCDPNVRGHNGDPVLHKACMRQDSSLMRTLISEYGADINATNNYGNTSLHVAALHGNEKLALALINEFNYDTKIQGYKGQTLLHFACNGGNVNLVRTLIREHNANIHARDDYKNTPLQVATLAGHEEVVETLINEFGCDSKC